METLKNKRKTLYRESVYVDGQRVRSPSFTRKADAVAWKSKLLAERDKAKIFGEELKLDKKEKVLFKDFLLEWLEKKVKVQRSASTYKNYERIARIHLIPVMGKVFIDQLGTKHADHLVKVLIDKGHNPKGVNLIIQTLKVAMYEAERQDVIIKNPFRHFKMLKLPKLPPRFWSYMEIKQFLQGNQFNPYYPLFVVALNTGMRRGELAGLCWDRVDFNRSMIEVSRIRDRYGLRNTTKSGTARHVPMNTTIKQALMKLYNERQNNFAFINKDGSPIDALHIYREFGKAQKLAKMENKIRFHDLRHCFASHFMMNGGNLYDLQKILGHTQFEMTQIYAHLSPDHLADKTEIISFG